MGTKIMLHDVVSIDEFNNVELKKQLEKEGLEVFHSSHNNNYQVRNNLNKLKEILLSDRKIDSTDYERYKTDIDIFLKENKKKIVGHFSDPLHHTIDYYSAEDIKNKHGDISISIEDYNFLTEDQKKDYEYYPFSDEKPYLYKESDFYKNDIKFELYKLLNKMSDDAIIKVLDSADSRKLLIALNGRDSYDIKTGNYLLHIAVSKALTGVVKIMLEKGANPDLKNNEGNTPLHIAVQESLSTTVKNLLDKRANPNLKNNEGNTPLHIAVQKSLSTTVKNLLDKGADKKIKNNEGNIPFQLATSNEVKKMVTGGYINKKSTKKGYRKKSKVKKSRRRQ